MIQSLQINHFRNHVGTRFEFGRFTLLAGPNGVGKSNVLRCLMAFDGGDAEKQTRRESDLDVDDFEVVLTLVLRDGDWIAATNGSGNNRNDSIFYRESVVKSQSQRPSVDGPKSIVDFIENFLTLPDFSGFFYLKPELPNLSSPHYSESAHPTLHSSGLGLASVLAYLMTSAPERFARIQDALKKIVPQVVRIRAVREMVEIPELQTVTVKSREIAYSETRQVPGDALVFDMKNAEGLSARDVSDGTLVVLALLTAIHQEPQPRILLLDDIETGLHPAAQESLMDQLRQLLDQTPELQIVATTHSPFIIDKCSPDEVWLLSPDEKGQCHAARMSDHPQAEDALRILTTGEFWSAEGEEWVLSKKAKKKVSKSAAPANAG